MRGWQKYETVHSKRNETSERNLRVAASAKVAHHSTHGDGGGGGVGAWTAASVGCAGGSVSEVLVAVPMDDGALGRTTLDISLERPYP